MHFCKSILAILFFKKYFIYLFMRDTERKGGRDIGRGRSRFHVGSPVWDSIPGLQDHTLSQKADTYLPSHKGVLRAAFLMILLSNSLCMAKMCTNLWTQSPAFKAYTQHLYWKQGHSMWVLGQDCLGLKTSSLPADCVVLSKGLKPL